MKQEISKDTSWEEVAVWYDSHLRLSPNSYQAQLILPNLKRLLYLKKGEVLLDFACGQGFFSYAFASSVSKVIGIDASKTLIDIARGVHSPNGTLTPEFYVAESHNLPMINDANIDTIIIVLALQNIRELVQTFNECSRVLKQSGSLNIVLNHPMFRVPQCSDWHYSEQRKSQAREVWRYLSEFSTKVVMNPGSKSDTVTTVSFHRPLQTYINTAQESGFVLSNLEEWTSHKKSEPGPRSQIENVARNEIPLFMYLKFQKNNLIL